MKSLAEIRAHLKAEQEKAEAQKNGTFTGERKADSFLAFWNVPYNEPLNLRFLPDADESNPFFWRERDMINLTFNGVVGMHTDKVTVQVPCNEMWVPKSCPVLKEVRQWFQSANETGNEELKAMAGRYWKKKTYLMQCFIAPDSVAVKDDIAPENPIRRILANKDIFDKVKSILLNPGIKESPTHYVQGRDFGIVKTKNGGGYNSYDMSQFSMSERPLNEEELAAIEKYGLYNLNDFMPKQPTPEELKAIEEMFEASVNGEAYDPARWAFAYRPAGVPKPNSGTVTESKPTPAPVAPTAPVTPAPQAAPVTPVATPAATTPEAPKEQLSASALVARLKQQGK
ncbi:Uncharacterised protein [Escherichia coli]|uniref:hypothetical protein n=1 Tax=Escherichia coli TaxID=562 RepID=UPI001A5915D4|nr:hypothetical protein [Escherichia coli]VVZ28116.1 Uncharacterised protein [Escherichia coli]VWN21243.1 Uncharacterised protein [Escherichia coli]